eukprot:GHVS01041636.1.p1 GENE.GHVS01041636.1~~GHVS01041636.1.p1  ORF type:complete len:577 (+),score=85.88 GHVS01041636.1:123-1733(+)
MAATGKALLAWKIWWLLVVVVLQIMQHAVAFPMNCYGASRLKSRSTVQPSAQTGPQTATAPAVAAGADAAAAGPAGAAAGAAGQTGRASKGAAERTEENGLKRVKHVSKLKHIKKATQGGPAGGGQEASGRPDISTVGLDQKATAVHPPVHPSTSSPPNDHPSNNPPGTSAELQPAVESAAGTAGGQAGRPSKHDGGSPANREEPLNYSVLKPYPYGRNRRRTKKRGTLMVGEDWNDAQKSEEDSRGQAGRPSKEDRRKSSPNRQIPKVRYATATVGVSGRLEKVASEGAEGSVPVETPAKHQSPTLEAAAGCQAGRPSKEDRRKSSPNRQIPKAGRPSKDDGGPPANRKEQSQYSAFKAYSPPVTTNDKKKREEETSRVIIRRRRAIDTMPNKTVMEASARQTASRPASLPPRGDLTSAPATSRNDGDQSDGQREFLEAYHNQRIEAYVKDVDKYTFKPVSPALRRSQQELVGSTPLYDQGPAPNGHQSYPNAHPELLAVENFKTDPAASPPVDPHVDNGGEAVSAGTQTGGDGR